MFLCLYRCMHMQMSVVHCKLRHQSLLKHLKLRKQCGPHKYSNITDQGLRLNWWILRRNSPVSKTHLTCNCCCLWSLFHSCCQTSQLPGELLFASLQASEGHKPTAAAHAAPCLTWERGQLVGGTSPDVPEAISSVLETCRAGQRRTTHFHIVWVFFGVKNK